MKKSSGANPASRHELVFFIDRSLGKEVVASKLKEAGYSVEIHDNHFKSDAPDEEWIAEVGRRNWVILTKDSKILQRLPEILAVVKGNARLYALISAKITGPQMAEIFVKAASKIVKSIPHQDSPCIAKIYSTGSVEIWMTKKQLLKKYGN